MSLGVYDNNPPAISCYKKCGFQIDGVLRDIQKHGDKYWSLMEMSILEDEWTSLNESDNDDLSAEGKRENVNTVRVIPQ
jgi:hypothetical protein